MATSVQYGIRHLMVLTLVVAMVMAVLGPMIRAWDTERQGFFAANAAITIAVLAASVFILCRVRLRIERAAGSVLFRTKAVGNRWVRVRQAIILVLCLAWMVLQCVHWSEAALKGVLNLLNFALLQFYILLTTIAPLLTRFWWGLSLGSVEVCQRGLVVGGLQFHSFGNIKHYRWSHYTPGSLVFVTNRTTWTVKIPTEARDDVDRLLESQVVRQFGGGEVK
jgi:hypothetical protein